MLKLNIKYIIKEKIMTCNIEFSVVIPVYNNPEAMRAIESVLNQSYTGNYEIIVVDDGSKDNSYETLCEYKEKNKLDNLTIIKQSNGGPSKARNRGIRESKGKYIAFLDSDDTWNRDKIKKQMEVLQENPEVKLISTTLNGRTIKGFSPIQQVTLKDLLYRNSIFTSTVVVEKEVLESLGGFDEKQKYSEDYKLWLNIASEHKCVVLNESLVTYGDGESGFGGGLSSKLWDMEKGELSNYKSLLHSEKISRSKYLGVVALSFSKYLLRRIKVRLKS